MKTARDHIRQSPAVPDPPAGATHALVWEPYGTSRSQWALVALDDSPEADAAGLMDGAPDVAAGDLAGFAAAVLGCPVRLSSRMEVDGEFAYYVIPSE